MLQVVVVTSGAVGCDSSVTQVTVEVPAEGTSQPPILTGMLPTAVCMLLSASV